MQTTTELSEALRRLFDMDEDDAREVSSTVLSAFDGADEVQDDHLDQDLRSIFYTLEAKKLLSFRREEYSAESGDRRRAFYWRLRVDEIRRQLMPREAVAETDVYAALPATAWSRGARGAS